MLRPVQLARLERANGAVNRLRQIEEDDVRVELRRRVAVYRPGTVVFKESGNGIAGCFRTPVPAEPCLHVRL
jgi:hypothetical protein